MFQIICNLKVSGNYEKLRGYANMDPATLDGMQNSMCHYKIFFVKPVDIFFFCRFYLNELTYVTDPPKFN